MVSIELYHIVTQEVCTYRREFQKQHGYVIKQRYVNSHRIRDQTSNS